MGKCFELEALMENQCKIYKVNQKELESLPPGRLGHANTKDGIIYFVYAEDGKKTTITHDVTLIRKLSRKEYLLEMNRRIEKNYGMLKTLLKRYREISPTKLIRSLREAYQTVPEDFFFTDDDRTDWEKEPYARLEAHPENLIHVTSFGLKVRSKSEQLIAEQLRKYKVEFRYEPVLKILEQTLHPDFLIKDKDDKIYVWEHFGMMSNPAYRKIYYDKMKLYRSAGINEWDNLVVTFDDENGNISTSLIDGIIKGRLL